MDKKEKRYTSILDMIRGIDDNTQESKELYEQLEKTIKGKKIEITRIHDSVEITVSREEPNNG